MLTSSAGEKVAEHGGFKALACLWTLRTSQYSAAVMSQGKVPRHAL